MIGSRRGWPGLNVSVGSWPSWCTFSVRALHEPWHTGVSMRQGNSAGVRTPGSLTSHPTNHQRNRVTPGVLVSTACTSLLMSMRSLMYFACSSSGGSVLRARGIEPELLLKARRAAQRKTQSQPPPPAADPAPIDVAVLLGAHNTLIDFAGPWETLSSSGGFNLYSVADSRKPATGLTAGIDLALRITERFYGHEVAQKIAPMRSGPGRIGSSSALRAGQCR